MAHLPEMRRPSRPSTWVMCHTSVTRSNSSRHSQLRLSTFNPNLNPNPNPNSNPNPITRKRLSHDMYGTGTVQSIAREGEEKITYVMFDAKDVIKVRLLRSPSLASRATHQPANTQPSQPHHKPCPCPCTPKVLRVSCRRIWASSRLCPSSPLVPASSCPRTPRWTWRALGRCCLPSCPRHQP